MTCKKGVTASCIAACAAGLRLGHRCFAGKRHRQRRLSRHTPCRQPPPRRSAQPSVSRQRRETGGNPTGLDAEQCVGLGRRRDGGGGTMPRRRRQPCGLAGRPRGIRQSGQNATGRRRRPSHPHGRSPIPRQPTGSRISAPPQQSRQLPSDLPRRIRVVGDAQPGQQTREIRHSHRDPLRIRRKAGQCDDSRIDGAREAGQVEPALRLEEGGQVQNEFRDRGRLPLPDGCIRGTASQPQQRVQPVRKPGIRPDAGSTGHHRPDPGLGGLRQRDRAVARGQGGERPGGAVFPGGRQRDPARRCVGIRPDTDAPHPHTMPLRRHPPLRLPMLGHAGMLAG